MDVAKRSRELVLLVSSALLLALPMTAAAQQYKAPDKIEYRKS